MQLNNNPKVIRRTLAFATATLLSNVAQSSPAADNIPWEVDTAVLNYEETGRVKVIEPVIRIRKDKGDDKFVTMRFVLDTLTGASPNGAIPTSNAQTFTGPSGSTSYTTAANTVPLDPNFHDTRVAFNIEWEQPAGKTSRSIYGLNLSHETDYNSLGVSATYNYDFNSRNTTFTTGFAFNADNVNPIGRAPLGLSVVSSTPGGGGGEDDDGDGEEFNINKHVYDILFGLTQVMGRKDLLQVNLNYGIEDGYLSDPYKLLSVVDSNGVLIASPNSYRHEKRPDTRNRTALFARWSHQFKQDVLRFSYRYFSDDWGIHSDTYNLQYRFELGARHYLEPHLRYYKQGAADFYYTSVLESEVAGLVHASADYRLGDLTTETVGIKYGWLVGKHSELGIRAETITQQATPSRVIGVQSIQELLPDIKAKILQLNFNFQF